MARNKWEDFLKPNLSRSNFQARSGPVRSLPVGQSAFWPLDCGPARANLDVLNLVFACLLPDTFYNKPRNPVFSLEVYHPWQTKASFQHKLFAQTVKNRVSPHNCPVVNLPAEPWTCQITDKNVVGRWSSPYRLQFVTAYPHVIPRSAATRNLRNFGPKEVYPVPLGYLCPSGIYQNLGDSSLAALVQNDMVGSYYNLYNL